MMLAVGSVLGLVQSSVLLVVVVFTLQNPHVKFALMQAAKLAVALESRNAQNARLASIYRIQPAQLATMIIVPLAVELGQENVHLVKLIPIWISNQRLVNYAARGNIQLLVQLNAYVKLNIWRIFVNLNY